MTLSREESDSYVKEARLLTVHDLVIASASGLFNILPDSRGWSSRRVRSGEAEILVGLSQSLAREQHRVANRLRVGGNS